SDGLFIYASYAFVNAPFRDPLELASPNAPVGVPCSSFVPADPQDEVPNCARVRPGDHIPSIPSHRLKFGFDYWVTPQWRVGGDLLRCRASSSAAMKAMTIDRRRVMPWSICAPATRSPTTSRFTAWEKTFFKND